ncbi:MAG: two-component system, OmpR family, sensor histidine kinase KdpD [Solirubrobacterales bacterium]|jgi:two-component system sensor histidine kinase KdpD|nr:two-component system, OmpR family, sensor histidine kinase KdpD [Solirubrobacterales bacterium]
MLRRRFPLGLSGEPPPAWQGLLATLIAVTAGTLLVYPLKSVAPVVSLGVVYLPAILLISIIWGLRLGLLAAIASAVAFNFFQLPPLHRFEIANGENWVALLVFAIVAAISSTVAGRARALEAERRRALKVILRDAGYEPVAAASGEEALDQAAVKPPAAAILRREIEPADPHRPGVGYRISV